MKRIFTFLLLTAWAGAVLSGCSDDDSSDTGPVTPPQPTLPVQLTAPAVSVSEVGPASFRASWSAVPEAAAYAYELYSVVDGTTTRVQQKERYAATDVLFEGLTASTAYEVRVRALAPAGDAFTDSEFGTARTETTAPEPTEPWVEIGLECVSLGGKLAVQITNTPNSLCAHYYLSTENVNVIGDGMGSEAELIGYLLEDYENEVPGVYRDKQMLTCNNNGSGLNVGQPLFYHVVGEDAAGKTGALNWVFFQVPEKAGDEVIVLDGPDRQ